jgi:hypothetical protein
MVSLGVVPLYRPPHCGLKHGLRLRIVERVGEVWMLISRDTEGVCCIVFLFSFLQSLLTGLPPHCFPSLLSRTGPRSKRSC